MRNESYGGAESTDVKRVVREYCLQFFKFSSLDEMGKFLERCKLLKK